MAREKSKMSDVMLDFETFGNGKYAAICQVGACYFNRHTGAIEATFKRNIDARSSALSGGEIDADTVYWWLTQTPEAIAGITALPQTKITEAMTDLNNFLEAADCIWSHATFDFVILVETMKLLNIKRKFHYKVARDIRTLVDIANVSTKDSRFVRTGTHHDALDDCLFQVKYCVDALSKTRVT